MQPMLLFVNMAVYHLGLNFMKRPVCYGPRKLQLQIYGMLIQTKGKVIYSHQIKILFHYKVICDKILPVTEDSDGGQLVA